MDELLFQVLYTAKMNQLIVGLVVEGTKSKAIDMTKAAGATISGTDESLYGAGNEADLHEDRGTMRRIRGPPGL